MVASHWEAWIEMAWRVDETNTQARSLPTGKRGLKLLLAIYSQPYIPTSLPTGKRGLKLVAITSGTGEGTSLPTGKRGLKYHHLIDVFGMNQSLPTGKRGLKYNMGESILD